MGHGVYSLLEDRHALGAIEDMLRTPPIPGPAKTWLKAVLAATSLGCKLCAAPLQDMVAELSSVI